MKGIISFILLICLALLAIILKFIFLNTNFDLSLFYKKDNKSLLSKSLLNNKLDSFSKRTYCNNSDVKLCFLKENLIDYNQIFLNFDQCNSKLEDKIYKHSSPLKCTNISKLGTYQTNLIQTKDLIQNETDIFASTGYIFFDAELKLKKDLLIVAIGDIHLKQVTNQSNNNIQLTILSAKGNVIINQIDSNIVLKQVKQNFTFPSLHSKQSLLPPVVDKYLFGIFR